MPDPARAVLWDVLWGLGAVAFIALWTAFRTAELDEALRAATPRESPPPEIARLSDAELAQRGRWLDALLDAQRRLEGAMSFARMFAHLSRAVPDGAQVDEVRAVSPYVPGRAAPWTVTVLAPDASRMLSWLRAEPYLAQTFPEARLVTVDGVRAAELARAEAR
jgi:hypothetical protein